MAAASGQEEGQGRERQGPSLIFCSAEGETKAQRSQVTSPRLLSRTRDLNGRESGFKACSLCCRCTHCLGYKQSAMQGESTHSYPCSQVSPGQLGTEYRMLEKWECVCERHCVCACTRMCREEECSRTEGAPFPSGHTHIHLGSFSRPLWEMVRAQGLQRKWHLPQIVSFGDSAELTVLKHQRPFNKNSTFLSSTSYLVMIHWASISGGIILHGNIVHRHNSCHPSATPASQSLVVSKRILQAYVFSVSRHHCLAFYTQ